MPVYGFVPLLLSLSSVSKSITGLRLPKLPSGLSWDKSLVDGSYFRGFVVPF
jgi:hypothetical protein